MTSRLATIAIALGAVAIFFGLAIVARGGVAAFAAEPALVALAVATVALTVAALLTSGNLSPGEREDRSNRWVIAAFGAIGLLLAWIPAWCDHADIWTLDGAATRWIGVALYAAGGALRLAPVFALGRRFSGLVAIQPGHELLTTGLYRVIRHPSYLGLVVNALGWALAFRAVVGVLLTVALIPPLIARIRAEERLLHAQFGAAYDAYCRRTSRLIPGIW